MIVLSQVGKNQDYNLNQNSIITLYGYTAKKDVLTKDERQKILTFILEQKIATKAKILEILSHSIRFNGKKSGNEMAVSKWRADMDFVNNYKIDSQRKVNGKPISRQNKKRSK